MDYERLQWPNEPKMNFMKDNFDDFLTWAFRAGASDIIVEAGEELCVKLNNEIHLVGKKRISYDQLSLILGKIYQPAAAAMLKGGKELNFNYQIMLDDDYIIRFRLNATACLGGRGTSDGIVLVIRTIPGEVPTASQLDIPHDILMATQGDVGIFFVTGPTGSGKSTTLAGIVSEIATTKRKHIITYESPIEFDLKQIPNRLSKVVQTEVPHNLENYRVATANSLRRAPDVILFGEGRDKETIAACILEAQTGHFVLTTLHTNSVALSFSRMADEFEPSERKGVLTKLIDATSGILHQRLYPKLEGGRIALREFLIFTTEIKRHLHVQIANGQDISTELDNLVRSKGQHLLADALNKFTQGIIDLDVYAQIVAEVGNPSDLECVPEIAKSLLEKKIINQNTFNIWMYEILDLEDVSE